MKRIDTADWSTINLDELQKLPKFELGGYHLQDDSGNGCAGDPPGFPTYFTRSVYNSFGNNPAHGYEMVIHHSGVNYGIDPVKWDAGETWETRKAALHALYLRLWNKLPLDHPRTQAWILATFKHHNHCYHAPGFKDADWSDTMLIWPGGCLGKTPFGTLKDVQWEISYKTKHESFDKWKDEEREAFILATKTENERIKRLCEEIATPDNHDGTILVRRYYPEFQPTPDFISGAFPSPGNWWETMSRNPGPNKCPGQYDHAHPVNGSWCQMCGWHETKQEAA